MFNLSITLFLSVRYSIVGFRQQNRCILKNTHCYIHYIWINSRTYLKYSRKDVKHKIIYQSSNSVVFSLCVKMFLCVSFIETCIWFIIFFCLIFLVRNFMCFFFCVCGFFYFYCFGLILFPFILLICECLRFVLFFLSPLSFL